MSILHKIYLYAFVVMLSPLYAFLLSETSTPPSVYLSVVANAILLFYFFMTAFQIGTVNGRTLERSEHKKKPIRNDESS